MLQGRALHQVEVLCMSILRADPYSRATRTWRGHARGVTGGVTLFALMFTSLSLIALSRLNHSWLQAMRSELVEAMLPTLETVSVPAVRLQQLRHKIGAYVKVLQEIDRLEQQNEELKRWEGRARELEREIARYRKLLNARDRRKFAFVTGRVVADGRGPFARSVILNVGRTEGIQDGYPVVNGDGLVGRTLNAGATAARVLLLTDPNSRVPVVFGANDTRGVMSGDATTTPMLKFMPQDARPAIGDEVRTSGHGGLFPPGLSVGRISQLQPAVRVSLHANTDRIDFVSVLLFGRPEVDDLQGIAGNRHRSGAANQRTATRDLMILPTRPRHVLRKQAAQRRAVKNRQNDQ